jgi:hypothetical protein
VRITVLRVAVGKITETIIIAVVAALVVLAEAVAMVVDATTTIAILKRDIKKTSFLIISTHR